MGSTPRSPLRNFVFIVLKKRVSDARPAFLVGQIAFAGPTNLATKDQCTQVRAAAVVGCAGHEPHPPGDHRGRVDVRDPWSPPQHLPRLPAVVHELTRALHGARPRRFGGRGVPASTHRVAAAGLHMAATWQRPLPTSNATVLNLVSGEQLQKLFAGNADRSYGL